MSYAAFSLLVINTLGLAVTMQRHEGLKHPLQCCNSLYTARIKQCPSQTADCALPGQLQHVWIKHISYMLNSQSAQQVTAAVLHLTLHTYRSMTSLVTTPRADPFDRTKSRDAYEMRFASCSFCLRRSVLSILSSSFMAKS